MGVNDVTPRTPAPACVWPMADINANPPVTTGKLTPLQLFLHVPNTGNLTSLPLLSR